MAIEILVNFAVSVINALGLPGIFVLMALESTAAPVPSEAVLPFAGFLVAQGKMELFAVILAATLGSIVGSLFSYYIGYFGGKPAVLKIGKYFLLNEKHLEHTEKFFAKHCGKTIFIARFVPVVRHLISIPAGIGKMQKRKFIALTAAGALIWNSFLIWAGMMLESRWNEILKYSQILDYVVLAVIAAVVIWYFTKAKR